MLAITSPGAKRPAAEPLPGRHRQPAHTAPARLRRHQAKLTGRSDIAAVAGGGEEDLAWVRPHTDAGSLGEEDLLLLADAQTSGGLLGAGELPGAPVTGELVPRRGSALVLR
jgi:hypothetical protein